MHQTTLRLFKPTLAAIALAMLAARGGDNDAPVVTAPEPEPTRLQDTRGYEPVVEATFAALAGSAADTADGPACWAARLTASRCPLPAGPANPFTSPTGRTAFRPITQRARSMEYRASCVRDTLVSIQGTVKARISRVSRVSRVFF